MVLHAVVGRAYLLENGTPPSSVLSKVSRSSSEADGCRIEAMERLKESIETDAAREGGWSSHGESKRRIEDDRWPPSLIHEWNVKRSPCQAAKMLLCRALSYRRD